MLTRIASIAAAILFLVSAPAIAEEAPETREKHPVTQFEPRPAPVITPTGGGEDVLLGTGISGIHVDIASNGDIYYLHRGADLVVWKSTDGGTTWQVWGTIFGGAFDLFEMDVIEGTENRLFILYRTPSDVVMTYSDLTATPTWVTQTVLTDSPRFFRSADFTTDVANYPGYYLYVVGASVSALDGRVLFARSVDQGTTWQASYEVGPLDTATVDGVYEWPNIAYGNPRLHVNWSDIRGENQVQYRSAGNFGAAIGDWDVAVTQITTPNGVDKTAADIAASTNGDQVIMAWWQGAVRPARSSSDDGVTWDPLDQVNLPFGAIYEIEYRASTDEFVLGGNVFGQGAGFATTAATTPLAFGTPMVFKDDATPSFELGHDIAFDPTRSDQVAMVWQAWNSTDWNDYFDAEWRGAPGYPVTEWIVDLGPQDLGERATAPALAELDADPEMEIVFADATGTVHLMDHDGVNKSGWPKDLGVVVGPVAIGDLDNNGVKHIVVGDAFGSIHAFRSDTGAALPGFPVATGTGAPVYVSVGVLGPPNVRYIVATTDTDLYVYNYAGDLVYSWALENLFVSAAAIGDLDLDDTPEIVVANGDKILTFNLGNPNFLLEWKVPGKTFYTQPALCDLDHDFVDYEIVVGTLQGDVYAIHHTGGNVTGWPFSDGPAGTVNAISLGHIFGTSEPDVGVTQENSTVHLLTHAGVDVPSSPHYTTPGHDNRIFGGPVMARTHTTSFASLVLGAKDASGWVFGNINGLQAGWPRALGDQCETTPAAGDIDNDGSNELVFVTNSNLSAYDVNHAPQGTQRQRWPMQGNTPGRESCLDCVYVLTAADPGKPPAATRALLSPAFPNPTDARGASFRYTLPEASQVMAEVYDVRGRRVRTLVTSQQPAGAYELRFDGRDGYGRELPSGQYFVRLRVMGAQGLEVSSQKVSIVR